MGSRIVSRIVAVLRLGFAVLAAYTLAYAANRAATAPRGVGMVDFFSYFTILSNISATIALAVGGVALLRGRGGLPDGVRGAVTSYMTVTGIIYAVVLRADAQEAGDLARWVDDVVHVVMPLVVFLDWLVVPPRVRQPYWILRYWLVFPAVYTVYSLIRGHFADWYPYPFLDPRGRGYGHVALECCVIAVVIAGVCLLVVWLGRFLRGKVSSDVMM